MVNVDIVRLLQAMLVKIEENQRKGEPKKHEDNADEL